MMKMRGENLMFEEIFELGMLDTTYIILCVKNGQDSFCRWKDEITGELP